MHLSEKIIWSCLITIAILFSVGGALLIQQNHDQVLQTTLSQNMNHHLISSYSLESNLLQDSTTSLTNFGNDKKKMQQQAISHLARYSDTGNTSMIKYALSDEQFNTITSTLTGKLPEAPLMKQTKTYRIYQQQQTYTMYLTSQIYVGNNTYYLLHSYDISSLYQKRNQQYRSFLMLDVVLLMLACIIIKALTAYILKPLRLLSETSKHIAMGNYQERTHMASNDEIGELSKNFDEMAQANEDTIHQLKLNAQQKEEFMGSFAHEVKTPMTAILGFADMLKHYECSEEDRQKAADFIYQEGKRLEQLSYHLMGLLSLSKDSVVLQSLSTKLFFEQLITYYQSIQPSLLHIQYEEATLLAHEELLFTLLRNLIENAIKASSNTEIIVKGVLYPDGYYLQVIDFGIGMSDEEVKKAREPFYMADKSRARTQGGSGLGLSLCQKICELHHTSLSITSIPQQGTTITIVLEVCS